MTIYSKSIYNHDVYSGYSQEPGYTHPHDKIGMNNQQLIEYHVKLSQCQDSGHLLFDIEDHILRKIAKNPDEATEYLDHLKDPALIQKINVFLKKGSRFLDATQKLTQVNDAHQKVKVIKTSLENTWNNVGGIGAVVLGLRSASEKLGLERVYSMHPLYVKDKSAARDCEFQGIVQHLYGGVSVESSIYKNRKDREYVIQPDARYGNIFDTSADNGIYGQGPASSLGDRVLYCGSALAAFVQQYSGKSKTKNVSIVHADAHVIGGCAFPLINQINQSRVAAGLFPIKCLFVGHGPLWEKLFVPIKALRGIGIHVAQSRSGNVDLIGEGMRGADKVLFVSSRIASEALSTDPQWNLGRKELLQGDRKVTAIRNGIAAENFDVASKEVFEKLAIERTFDLNGNETTDYLGYRQHLKELLFKAALIADASLPLVLYLGRYSEEKGIDVLVDTIGHGDQLRTQFVTMGIDCGQENLIHQLQLMEKLPSYKLRCYTTKSQQTAKFKLGKTTYSISVSQMIRAAADFVFVPSHAEACGLVAMEGQCAGSLLVAPYHQGLMDICKPDGYDDTLGGVYSVKKDANAVCYCNHADFGQARSALSKAVNLWEQMFLEEKNRLACRIRNDAILSYSWYHKDEEKKVITGAAVAYHQLYQELLARPVVLTEAAFPVAEPVAEKEFTIVPPVQRPIISVPRQNQHPVLRLARKISLWIHNFFSTISRNIRRWSFSLKAKIHFLGPQRNYRSKNSLEMTSSKSP